MTWDSYVRGVPLLGPLGSYVPLKLSRTKLNGSRSSVLKRLPDLKSSYCVRVLAKPSPSTISLLPSYLKSWPQAKAISITISAMWKARLPTSRR